MKKVISICIILTICLTSICISGCSDFAFNPIGRWSFVEDIYYSNDKPYSKVTSEDDPAMNNVAVVFCDRRQMPKSMLMTLDGNSTQQETYRFQIEASLPTKKNIWKQ